MIAGPEGSDTPERFIPMLNAARSPTFYEFDSGDLLRLYREMDAEDEVPVVIYHSHTATDAYPSLGNLGQSLRLAANADDPSAAKGLPEGLGIGDPDHLVAVIRRWEAIGVDGINFVLNAGEVVSQEDVLGSLRLFASEVIPRFRSRESAASRVEAPTTLPEGIDPC